MSTLILTGSDSVMHKVLDLTLESKIKYCEMHGYDFLSVRSFDADDQLQFSSNHVGFLRAVKAFKMLNFYNNVMWIDGDSIITNFDYTIDDFIANKEAFIASYDWMTYNSFSTGNFILRNVEGIDVLYNLFIQCSIPRTNDIMAEQGTLNQIYGMNDYKHLFNILPHKFLGSVPNFMVKTKTWVNDNNRSGIVEPWTEESFLCHLTGASVDERVDILTNFEKWKNEF